jgi:AcrR family transcriptional regulator
MTTSNSKIEPESDGRRQRTERSRTAIIEASLSLLEEGILVPTAQQISDRAGVGIRTFFRHFEDMNTLFKAVDDSIRRHYETLILAGDRNGSLEERIDHAVDRHAAVYEQVANVILSAAAQRWRYDVLRKNYARSQRGLRKDLDNLLPEIKDLPQSTREAIDAIASFELWNRLREHQGQSKRSTISIVSSLLKTLIIH